MKLYLIRHAESKANVASDLDNPTYYFDARITKRGVKQAQKLKKQIQNIPFDGYFSSPLTRTLETFSILFPDNQPFIDPQLREHLFHSCDIGRQPKYLKKEFKKFNFDHLKEYWWNNDIPINENKIVQENLNKTKIRLKSFLLSIKNLKFTNVVVISHGTFLKQITGYMMDNCELYKCDFKTIYERFFD
tara:strand:+ start:129 stop:695 length:567 start_codon:yes stop_codon:yes gene_type:complete